MNKKPLPLIFCDYIAHVIAKSLRRTSLETDNIIARTSEVVYKTGSYTKTVKVTDKYGTNYKITIETI